MDRAFLPPSRASNPFATCWTRPGALPFRFATGASGEELIARLTANDWWGEIVGPHGSGKSTLLETLKPLLAAAGRTVSYIALHDGQRRLPAGWLRTLLAMEPSPKGRGGKVVIVDGYEQLAWSQRGWLRWRCRRAAAGLLVTSHVATGLPRLIELQPTRALIDQLVATLTAGRSSPITAADVAAGYACHGGNVRELFFALYDCHERRCRAARTGIAMGA